jgi:hypothetical protein
MLVLLYKNIYHTPTTDNNKQQPTNAVKKKEVQKYKQMIDVRFSVMFSIEYNAMVSI